MSHPPASSPGVRARMQKQRSRDTGPELALRRELHRRGLRYRVHRRPLPALRREADIVFPTERVAVFVDGCYWHGCEEHSREPKANAGWWREKIGRNRERDQDTDLRLLDEGWAPLRVWEHQDPSDAADVVETFVRLRGLGLCR